MTTLLGNPIELVLDGENNPVEFDYAYPLRGNLPAAVAELRRRHGDELLLLPMSATSCGGGIFQASHEAAEKVIGLRFDAPVEAGVRKGQVSLVELEADEIVIDSEAQQICCGAAITLQQLNQALARTLDPRYRVAGADLTSYQYAAAGATFMTGGMGPQRRYFSDSVCAAAVYNGREIELVEGDELQAYAGTYGWSGIVSALRCCYHRFPQNEISFALPVSNAAPDLARLLARLAPLTDLRLHPDGVTTGDGHSDMILGLEHVSSASMRPLLEGETGGEIAARARDLANKCRSAGADGLIFVNALSDASIDEFLYGLLDDPEAETLSIAGISLEQAEIFNDAEVMRDLREAIPYAARMQTPAGRFIYKNHTDANLRLDPQAVEADMARLWQINQQYVDAVRALLQNQDGVDGDILIYGHLNPQGVDPHNRVTMSCDDENLFVDSRARLIELRARYYGALASLCDSGNTGFIGGEKSADSEIAIYAALGGPHKAPTQLLRKFERQRKQVSHADRIFNWRAPSIYLGDDNSSR